MIKTIILFCVLCFALPANAWMGATGGAVSQQDSAAVCDTTNVTLWWRAEAADFSGTNGTLDYASGDEVATLSGGAAINTDAVKYGTNGLDINSSFDYALFDSAADEEEEGRVGFWLYINSWGTGAGVFRVTGAGADNTFKVLMSGSDELTWTWRDSATNRTALTTAAANLSTATWYFVELAWKTSTDYREIFVDGSSEGSSAATINNFAVASALRYFGDFEGVAVDYHMDNLILSTDSTVDLYTACKDELEWPE